ncbi:MAG: hypothetical protein ACJAVE_001369 [Polaribacter sp.]|jgi:hypothetical protein
MKKDYYQFEKSLLYLIFKTEFIKKNGIKF